MEYQTQNRMPKMFMPVILIIGLAVIMIARSAVIIRSGKAGVLYRMTTGVDTTQVIDEGFHLIAPWNNVIVYEVRQQDLFEKMSVLSLNGLEIAIEATAWYQPVQSKLGSLHKEKGQDYLETIVKPAIRSATRSVLGRYTPEQIYSSKRDAIENEIYEETKKILDHQYIELREVLVRDVTLPKSIKAAIERKLGQEQESLEYEFRLQKASKEAERQRIEAEGKANANRILNASLSENILKEKGIEATLELAKSPNAKVVVVGGSDGLPLILGNN